MRSFGLLVCCLLVIASPSCSSDGTAANAGDPGPGRDGGAGDGDGASTPPPPPPSGDAGGDAGPGGRDYSTDRGKFFGDSRCATANLRFCDDFESGTLDTATWSVVGTAPVVDGVQHARGSKALHVTRTGNGASYVKETKTFPATNNTYYGRMFVWFDKLPTVSGGFTYAHWTFAAASGTGTVGEIRLSGQLQSGANHFGVGTDSGGSANGTGDWTNSDDDPAGSPKAVPTGEWVCIEWLHDGQNNVTKFWWDAVEHTSLATTSTKHGGNGNAYILPTFTNLWVGWQEYQTTNEPFELWIDEVAVDDQRIGCVL